MSQQSSAPGSSRWWRRQWPVQALVPSLALVLLVAFFVNVLPSAGDLAWVFLVVMMGVTIVVGRLVPQRLALTEGRARAVLALPVLGVVGAVVPLLGRAVWVAVDSQDSLGHYLVMSAALWAVAALGSGWALWTGRRPALWGCLCAVAGIAHPLVVRFGCRVFFVERQVAPGPSADPAWTLVGLGLATLYAGGAVLVARRRGEGGMEAALAALTVVVTVQLSWLLVSSLDGTYLLVALALEIVVLAWLAGRLDLPVLGTMAVLGSLVVVVALPGGPHLPGSVGGPASLASLLAIHAAAIAAVAAAAFLLDRRPPGRGWPAPAAERSERDGQALRLVALALLVFALFAWIDHVFHLPGLDEAVGPWLSLFWWDRVPMQWSGYSAVGLALGAAVLTAARRWPAVVGEARRAGPLLVVCGLLVTLVWPFLLANPLWTDWPVAEWSQLHLLAWTYGAPAVLLVLAALAVHRAPERERLSGVFRHLPAACGIAALVAALLLITSST